jgi:hypothetical protein
MKTHGGLALAVLAAGACGGYGTESVSLEGTYVATVLRVTPEGQALIDVLAAGGSLSVTIGSNNAVSGTLIIPASLNQGVPLNASMAGTAARDGNTVEFNQSADTFVRDLSWELSADGLRVTNQAAGDATYTITLTRQGNAYLTPY